MSWVSLPLCCQFHPVIRRHNRQFRRTHLSVDHRRYGYSHSGGDRLHLIKLEEITCDLRFHLIGNSFVLIYFMSALTQMFTLGDPSYLPPPCPPAGSPWTQHRTFSVSPGLLSGTSSAHRNHKVAAAHFSLRRIKYSIHFPVLQSWKWWGFHYHLTHPWWLWMYVHSHTHTH